MTERDSGRLRSASPRTRVEMLAAELPPLWQPPLIGPGIESWPATGNNKRRLDLRGLPEPFAVELAWMAHWQECTDGTPASVQPINQLVLALRRAIAHQRPIPSSIRDMDAATADELICWFYTHRWRRLPPAGPRHRLRALFRIARLALVARCHDGPWWGLDDWSPRSDPRIPLHDREPRATLVISPGRLRCGWLRAAVKWHLGTQLQAGELRWSTIGQARLLARFDRWLAEAFDDPAHVFRDPAEAAAHAAAYRRWLAEPAHRNDLARQHRYAPDKVHPRLINTDLRAVAELFDFVATNRAEARSVVGPSPWDEVSEAHIAGWAARRLRFPHPPTLNDDHYVDDRALAQITAALPLLGLPRQQQMSITRGDGTEIMASGFGDPQAMRMILLQILTGRRVSEIRTAAFDCLAPAPTPAGAMEGEQEVVRFRYAQSKIDGAPDSILVDREVAAVIEEQQRWVREHYPQFGQPRYLFLARKSNLTGAKPYSSGTYSRWLREFSEIVAIADSRGRGVRLSHTHRFRHTRLTRLAELGLPITVLQRYAGHATPTMSMHYIARRHEHDEQAFLATAKLRADGTSVQFGRDDHDVLHLFDRADRMLPHGWCLLPPLQSCDKGNACLTCSVFVTDDTHRDALQRQLDDTDTLIEQTTTAFARRHGRTMPDDNVWLAQRRAERDALHRLLAALHDRPDRAVQGAGCGTAAAPGPVPLTLHRRDPREATS
ncbi:MAG: tyrosine-type recombinase/integrase [Pseudonocardia sp.]|nr:tyrosine-type recombinase/integrase [Pseudonocardia sp.]